MSYINDALRKAQKEKKTDSGRFGNWFSDAYQKTRVPSGWHSAVGILVIFLFAAGLVALLYWPWEKQTRTVVHSPGLTVALPSDDEAVVAQPGPLAPAQPEEAVPGAAKDVLPVAVALEGMIDGPVAREQPRLSEVPAEKKEAVVAKDPDALYAQALRLQNEGQLAQAETLYKQVLKIAPRHLAAINNLGVVYMQQKKYQQAIARFDEALHVRHDYVKAHYNLACVYARKNDVDRSLFYLKNALDFNPVVRKWVEEDQDFKNLAGLPEFKNMLQKRSN
jgi:tetratricopeptide (TPR) repeat protein